MYLLRFKYAFLAAVIAVLFISTRAELDDVRMLGTQNMLYTGELAETTRLERELMLFHTAAAEFAGNMGSATHEEVQLAFDILWSRVNTQYSKKFIARIEALGSYEEMLKRLANSLRLIEADVQGLKPGDLQGWLRIESTLRPFVAPVLEMTGLAYAELQQRSLDQTLLQRRAMQGLNRVQLVFLFVSIGTLLLLVLQLRRGERLLDELPVREREISLLATQDHLTGLFNRRQFDSFLEAMDKDEGKQQFTLLVIDLDGFKPVNDSRGHAAGDQVLKIVADRLRLIAEPEMRLARLGGDEFALLLSCPHEHATQIAGNIVSAMEKPMLLDGASVTLGVCIGIAVKQGGPATSTQLMQEADAALYHAKKNGKNQFVYYSEDLRKLLASLPNDSGTQHLEPEPVRIVAAAG